MTLEQRITALERRVQLHRHLIVAVILVAALAMMLAASQDPKVNDVVQTKRLEVFNQAGRRVFVAEADSTSGHGRAAVLNASGGPVIVATGEETGGAIMFFAMVRSCAFPSVPMKAAGFCKSSTAKARVHGPRRDERRFTCLPATSSA